MAGRVVVVAAGARGDGELSCGEHTPSAVCSGRRQARRQRARGERVRDVLKLQCVGRADVQRSACRPTTSRLCAWQGSGA
jgi:hypothetical protein